MRVLPLLMVLYSLVAQDGFPRKVPSQELIRPLIEKLRADSIEEREEAEACLLKSGIPGYTLVVQACRSKDQEIASRARGVLRRFPAAIRMEDLYGEGFSRQVILDHPDLAEQIWSDDSTGSPLTVPSLSIEASPGHSLLDA